MEEEKQNQIRTARQAAGDNEFYDSFTAITIIIQPRIMTGKSMTKTEI
jgi:hypothetical protein